MKAVSARFFRRRECLVPAWQAIVLLAFAGCVLMIGAALTIHSFLGLTQPVAAEVLVVEGWTPAYVLEAAKAEFERHKYKRVYVTGGPVEIGRYLSEYRTYADVGSASLVRMGINAEMVQPVRVPLAQHDRTYRSAVLVHQALQQQGLPSAGVNVITIGAHARRTALLFRRAFGQDARVGIIAVDDRDYDSGRWWTSSQGVRTVLGESIAYAYASLVFPLTAESN